MTIEDFNSLLEELTHDDLTTERQLEIFTEIRNDKQKALDDYQVLTDSTLKLKNDYDSLKKKSISDFFNSGVKVDDTKIDSPIDTEEKVKTYDEIVDAMLEK